MIWNFIFFKTKTLPFFVSLINAARHPVFFGKRRPRINAAPDLTQRRELYKLINAAASIRVNTVYIRQIQSIAQFKKQIKLNLNPKPKSWYSLGNRKISIALARLRMDCSSLKNDLFKLNIIDSSHCECGFDKETCKHYFLDCPLYNTEREILMTDLRNFNFNLTLRNLLYGDDNLSDEFNVLAYLSIQYFMKETKRFD